MELKIDLGEDGWWGIGVRVGGEGAVVDDVWWGLEGGLSTPLDTGKGSSWSDMSDGAS